MSGLLDTHEFICYHRVRYTLLYVEGESMKNNVREFRDTHELTQKELGEKVGVSRQAINAIETGKFDPSIWLAYDLSKYFGVSIEMLFIFNEEDRK